jgi:hypothetical protein
METIASTRNAPCTGRLLPAIIASVVAMTGCGSTPPQINTKTETEIAVANVKSEWLKACEGVMTPMPGNEIGLLLQDHAGISALLAECIARHNDFADYMRPVVEKERGRK